MQELIIASHIASGTIVLLLGLLIMWLPKGGKTHNRLGWFYVASMWIVCLSAFSSIAFYRFSLFLLVVGIMTFYATYHGIRVVRRAKTFFASWYDYLVGGLVACSGLGLLVYSGYLLLIIQNHYTLAGLSAVFGIFILMGAMKDLRFYLGELPEDRSWWLYQHISAMGGSYIAAVTAFAVQNSNLFSIPGSIAWLPWILPGVAGGLIINKVIGNLQSKKKSPAQ